MKKFLPKNLINAFFVFLILITTSLTLNAQVGINTVTPEGGSILDITSSDKGLLIPRVDITDLSTIAPITGGGIESLLVYNTNITTGPGFFYWDGDDWIGIGQGNDWKVDGNNGTTPGTGASQNFLGTTDNQDLVVATNSTEAFRVNTAGRILATQSGSAASPLFGWSGDSDKGFYSPGADQFGLVTNGTERLRIPNANAVRAMANGTNSLPFYSWNSDSDLGIWRSDTDRLNISAGGREMVEFNENGSNSEVVFNDGSTNSDFRVESDSNDNILFVDGGSNAVGVGTNTPGGILDLTSTTNGFVPPRVSLTSTTASAPVVNPQGGSLIAGTTVYNTATAGTAPNDVAPGLYYWNGSRWVAYAGSPGGLDWTLTGNSGTTPITNYLGTTDDVALAISTNSAPRILINSDNTANGEVIVNSTGYFGNYMLQSHSSSTETAFGGFGTGTEETYYGQSTGGGLVGLFLTSSGDGFRSLSSLSSGNGVQGTGGAFTSYSFPGVSSGGVFAGTYGVSGLSLSATGTGVAGLGQGRTTIVIDPNGSGVAASGDTLGLFAYAGEGDVAPANEGNAAAEFSLDADNDVTTTNGNNGTRARAKLAGFDDVTPDGVLSSADSYYGGYFSGGSESSGTPSYAYVGMRYNTNSNGNGVLGGGLDYKIIGTGSVSTLIDGPDGNPRVMFAPEAPEILFQDFGVGQLVNGEVRIDIDPILRKSIHVDAQNPLKVYVTLEGDCNGVFVTDKSAEGFTVKELQGGTSNAAFSWQIVASRADRVGADGRMISQHVGVRLPQGPAPVKAKTYVAMDAEGSNHNIKNNPNTLVTKGGSNFQNNGPTPNVRNNSPKLEENKKSKLEKNTPERN